MVIHWNTEKLNKYLSRIDGAILQGRYYLALKLANRLLKQYYRTFISAKIPYERERDNIRLMAISICRYLLRYFRKYRVPYSERALLSIALVTNVVFINMTSTSKDSPEDQNVIDRATATYVRDNVSRIVRYLMKYL
ncbi:MAG: hypothetical protein D6765_00005 [Bacteroidetes bacterium]|nr:MAG: hypothetical protein D6765_00005 [Bacteroidota bacterium]